MDADKFVGNEFGRAKRGAKPEPHGCGEPIQAMDGNKSFVQMLDSGNMPALSFMFAVAGTTRCPQFAILGRWISASLPK